MTRLYTLAFAHHVYGTQVSVYCNKKTLSAQIWRRVRVILKPSRITSVQNGKSTSSSTAFLKVRVEDTATSGDANAIYLV